jgi:hypothetical protein
VVEKSVSLRCEWWARPQIGAVFRIRIGPLLELTLKTEQLDDHIQTVALEQIIIDHTLDDILH